MCVRYQKAESSFKNCPGGGPQGGLLTGILFILQVKKAGGPCQAAPSLWKKQSPLPAQPLPKDNDNPSRDNVHHRTPPNMPTHAAVEKPSLGNEQDRTSPIISIQEAAENPSLGKENIPLPLCHLREDLHKKAFVDDLTLLEKIKLSKLKVKNRIIGPLNFHDRFNLEYPTENSILQHQLDDLKKFTKERSMIINSKKTKCLPFISSKTKDFLPTLSLENNTHLEDIYELKLVGIVLTSDLTWHAHIRYIVSRVSRTIWQLVRFRQLGAPRKKLITLYILKVRSILMFGAVCYHSSLTAEQSAKLELQQKRCLGVILGPEYISYSNALTLTSLPRLDKLRTDTCIKWAIKAQSDPKHSDLFPLLDSQKNTRSNTKFLEQFSRGSKLYKSAIPYMRRELNRQ